MKLEEKFLYPSFGTFLKFWLLSIIPFFALGALVYTFDTPEELDGEMIGWWISLGILPIGTAVGLTFGTRRRQLRITECKDFDKVKKWVLEILLNKELRIKSETEMEVMLESNKGPNRIFGNWFGLELVSIKRGDDGMVIIGPYRFVDHLDIK